MSKIEGVTMGNVVKPYRVRQGTGAVYVADSEGYDPVFSNVNHGMPSDLMPVGLTDGSISINPNIETADITSDQMYTTFDSPLTGYNFTIEMSLDQSDLYNLQLGLALSSDAIDYNTTITGSTTLKLNAELQDPEFYAVQIKTTAPREAGASSLATQIFNFWKCKVNITGAVEITKTAKTTLPIQIRAFGNSEDSVGYVEVQQEVSAPSPAWGVH